MSKKSNNKQLNNRLDTLFSELDLEQDVELNDLIVESPNSGWIWRTDSNGVYTTCSDEVLSILGFNADEFIGQSVIDFAVEPESRSAIESAFNAKKFPVEVNTQYTTKTGQSVEIALHIFLDQSNNENGDGWRGFANVLAPTKSESTPPAKQPVASKETDELFMPDNQPVVETIFEAEKLPPPTGSLEAEEAEIEIQEEYSAPETPQVSADLVPEFTVEQPSVQELLKIIDSDPDREWTKDDMLIVEQVSSQLSLALENAQLFKQTQSALGETDTLYQASAELNAAQNYGHVLSVLRNYTLLGKNSIAVNFNLFNHPWIESEAPDWFEALYRLTEIPPESFHFRYTFADYPSFFQILRKDEPTQIINIKADPRIDEKLRTHYTDQINARSLIYLPVVLGGEWLGFIEGLFKEPSVFNDAEIRRLNTVTIQAAEKAIGIQLSTRVETRRRNADNLTQIARQMTEIVSEVELRKLMVDEIYEQMQPDQVIFYEWIPKEEAFLTYLQKYTSPDKTNANSLANTLVSPDDDRDLWEVFNIGRAQYLVDDWTESGAHERYILPWYAGDQISGIIDISHIAHGSFISDLDRDYVEGIILQAASAIERARLFDQTRAALALTDEQARRLGILNQMSAELSQIESLDELFSIAVRRTQDIFHSDRSSIALLSPNEDHLIIKETLGEQGTLERGGQMPIEGTSNHVAISENRVIISPDTKDNTPGALRSFIIAPLSVGGKVIGTLNVGSLQALTYADDDENFMQQLISLLASIIENRQLFETVEDALAGSEEQARRLSLLNEMSEELTLAANIQDIARIATTKTQEIMNAKRVSLTQVESDSNSAKILAVSGIHSDVPIGSQVPLEGAIETALRERRLVLNEEAGDGDLGSIRSTMVAPLIIAGQVIYTLNVGSEQNQYFSQGDQNVLTQIASLLSGTLENTQLFNQIQHRSAQLQASAGVSNLASEILDSTELFQKVIEEIRQGFDLYYAGIFLIDEIGEWTGEPGKWAVLRAGTGEAGQQMLLAEHKLEIGGDSMIGYAVSSGEAKIALHVAEEAKFYRNPYLPNTLSEMALPLISRGESIGALTIQSEKEAAFTQDDITALQTMADQVANAIENVSLFEQTQERAEELAVLNEMARAFTQILDINTILDNIHKYTSRLMDAQNFYIALYDNEQSEIHLPVFYYNGEPHEDQGIRFKAGNGITEMVIRNREPLLIEQDASKWMQENGLEVRGYDSQSWLGVPMLRGREVTGVITVQSYTTPREYTGRHLDLLSAIANQAAVAIENARLFQQTQARARREQILREITARVHSSADADSIMRTAVHEISTALGRKSFISLGPPKQIPTNIPFVEEPPEDLPAPHSEGSSQEP
ncbi:MAG: GAF domain-containing protein [Chloroflexi bacterium]|nr:GAF domain-containing protein [Chloroflexota bacterium]